MNFEDLDNLLVKLFLKKQIANSLYINFNFFVPFILLLKIDGHTLAFHL